MEKNRKVNDQSSDEDSVADYASFTEDNPNYTVRLKSGFEVDQLLRKEGVILEPDEDELNQDEENGKRYFDIANVKELDEILQSQATDVAESQCDDENDNLTSFQRKAIGMKDLREDGLVKKRLLKPGLECDGNVPDRSAVVIHYSCMIEDQDEPYDSTYLRSRPERHRLGNGVLLPGIEIAILSMKKCEKSEFIIQPQLAYGPLGCPPRIPQNAALLVKIELMDFAEEGEAEAMLAVAPEERGKNHSFDQIIEVVKKEHKEGNRYTKKQEYRMAAKCFERGVRLLEDAEMANDEHEAIQKTELKKLQANRGYCYLKCNWPKKACLALQEAASINVNDKKLNPKIFYRLGLAKKKLGHFEQAMENLKRAHSMLPNDPDIGSEIANVDKIIKKERDDEKALYQHMFRANKNEQERARPNKTRPHNFDDENYAEIMDQLEAFAVDDTQSEMTLPKGMDSVISLVESGCSELNMSLERSPGRNPIYKVVKPPPAK